MPEGYGQCIERRQVIESHTHSSLGFSKAPHLHHHHGQSCHFTSRWQQRVYGKEGHRSVSLWLSFWLLSVRGKVHVATRKHVKAEEVACTGRDLSAHLLWKQSTVGMLRSYLGPLGGDTFLLLKSQFVVTPCSRQMRESQALGLLLSTPPHVLSDLVSFVYIF